MAYHHLKSALIPRSGLLHGCVGVCAGCSHWATPVLLCAASHLQDVRCATLLSELVYKAADAPDELAFRQAQIKVEEAVGASLSHVRCHKSGGQR